MARRVCSACGKTLARMDFVRGRGHRTEQGFYCHDCFAGMLSDVREGASSSTEELEEDVSLLEALEETLPAENLPPVDDGPVDPGAQTVSAPAPEPSTRATDSTIISVAQELGTAPDPSTLKAPAKRERKGARPRPERRADAPASGHALHYVIAAILTVIMLVIAYLVMKWGG